MMIKVFSSMIENKLSKTVNEFMADKSIEVLELQYSSTIFNFSVMVVYKKAGE